MLRVAVAPGLDAVFCNAGRAALRRERRSGRFPGTAHLSAVLEPPRLAPDAWAMRNLVVSGVTLLFGAVLLLGYLTISLAARTALAMAPADRP